MTEVRTGALEAIDWDKAGGLVPAVVLGGCVTVGVAAVTAWRAPKLRRLHFHELVAGR